QLHVDDVVDVDLSECRRRRQRRQRDEGEDLFHGRSIRDSGAPFHVVQKCLQKNGEPVTAVKASRSAANGSTTPRHSRLSIMVVRRPAVNGSQRGSPAWFGSPPRAKATQARLIRSASAWRSGPSPTIDRLLSTLS